MPDLVILADHHIPVLDGGGHFGEGLTVDPKGERVTEVRIVRKDDYVPHALCTVHDDAAGYG
jgi:hypothetical protein